MGFSNREHCRYPIELAAKVAVATVRSQEPAFPVIEEVLFCCFSQNDLAVHEGVLGEAAA